MSTKHDWLRGCATALVTPFKAGGAVDEQCMKALVERQIAGGVKLLVPCGTTGERATMDDAEGRRVIELTVQVAKGRAKVIAGAGSNNTAHAIHQAKEAATLGADAVLIVAPYYNKPTQEGMLAHFRAVAEAVAPLPVVMYNVPGRTSSTIEAATTLKLAREVPEHRRDQGSVGQLRPDHDDPEGSARRASASSPGTTPSRCRSSPWAPTGSSRSSRTRSRT